MLEFPTKLIPCKPRLTIFVDSGISASTGEQALEEDKRYWFDLAWDLAGATARIRADGLVIRSRPGSSTSGIIDTKSQAGILEIVLDLSRGTLEETTSQTIEVLPTKFDLGSYRMMISDIADHVLDLALRFSSSFRLPLRHGHGHEAGLLQKFFYLKHLLTGDQFRAAIERIERSPQTRLEAENVHRTLLTSRKLGRSGQRAIASGLSRIPVPKEHPLAHLRTLPRAGELYRSAETLDTPENRFVKFALSEFQSQLEQIERICSESKASATRRVGRDAYAMRAQLAQLVNHSWLRDVGRSTTLPFGSPVLQRRTGYRDILSAWLKFQVAALLDWDEGEDVFSGGKKDTDRLYEYWVFFRLLDLLNSSLGIPPPPPQNLFEQVEGGIRLKLKAGKNFEHQGSVAAGGARFRLRLSYNRTFGNNKDPNSQGSWSLTMRPDFTISIWPEQIPESLAEKLYLMVHLHFDTKYRLEKPQELFNDFDDVEETKAAEKRGQYKRADILVAHTYRDAIRRSGGSFILYPGVLAAPTIRSQYDEVLPGIGAFPIRPTSAGSDTGLAQLGEFLVDTIAHLANRGSAFVQSSYAMWQVYEGGDFPLGWPLGLAEVKNGKRVPPAYNLALTCHSVACFPIEWVRARGVYPLLLSDDENDSLLNLALWRSAAILLLQGHQGKPELLPLVGQEPLLRSASMIDSEFGEVPSGVYALLPIALDAAVSLVPLTSSSLDELVAFVSKRKAGNLPLDELPKYFRL